MTTERFLAAVAQAMAPAVDAGWSLEVQSAEAVGTGGVPVKGWRVVASRPGGLVDGGNFDPDVLAHYAWTDEAPDQVRADLRVFQERVRSSPRRPLTIGGVPGGGPMEARA